MEPLLLAGLAASMLGWVYHFTQVLDMREAIKTLDEIELRCGLRSRLERRAWQKLRKAAGLPQPECKVPR